VASTKRGPAQAIIKRLKVERTFDLLTKDAAPAERTFCKIRPGSKEDPALLHEETSWIDTNLRVEAVSRHSDTTEFTFVDDCRDLGRWLV
jgi:hypothetical protein